jgi:3-phytase
MSCTQPGVLAALILLLLSVLAACSRPSHPSVDIRPALATAPVSDDPDDPAVWVHPSERARSLIVGTNRVKAPAGALVVFGLDGKIRQTISGLDRPNNVDVEYGLIVGGQPTDIAVLTERLKHRLRIFKISRDGGLLTDISSDGGAPVLEGETGERSEPMGIALYRRPRDGAVFAIISPKTGPRQGYLWEYRLEDDGAGRVKATQVRRFGGFSGTDGIEVVSAGLGPQFPHGLLVVMNAGPKNFLVYRWEEIADTGSPTLKVARR